MNDSDLTASIERLMAKVDYYLHCELDDEYQHDQPHSARAKLESALRQELLRAGAIGLVTSISAGSRVHSGSDQL